MAGGLGGARESPLFDHSAGEAWVGCDPAIDDRDGPAGCNEAASCSQDGTRRHQCSARRLVDMIEVSLDRWCGQAEAL